MTSEEIQTYIDFSTTPLFETIVGKKAKGRLAWENSATYFLESSDNFYEYVDNVTIKDYTDYQLDYKHRAGTESVDLWHDDPLVEYYSNQLETNHTTLSTGRLNVLKARSTTKSHHDKENPTLLQYQLTEVRPIDMTHHLLFMEDQRPGQTFHFGGEYIEWKSGDVFKFPWYVPHGGDNQTDYDRWSFHLTLFDVQKPHGGWIKTGKHLEREENTNVPLVDFKL